MPAKDFARLSILPACYACDGGRTKISYKDLRYRVLHCLNCGLYFVNPIPTVEGAKSSHSDILYKKGKEEIQIEKEKVRANVTIGEVVKLSSQGELSGKRLLDIGSGYGFFLKKLSERGWDAYGCEQNIIAREYAEKMGLKVYQDLKHKDLWRENFYDVITLWNVLEHSDDPLQLLRDCNRLLDGGGAIVVRVPNIYLDNMLWRIAKLRGRARTYMDVPMHLFGFTVSSLKSLLKRAGFINIHIIPSPLGDYSYYLEKRFGRTKSQLMIKLAEYLNLAILKLALNRSAGFLSITMIAYRRTT